MIFLKDFKNPVFSFTDKEAETQRAVTSECVREPAPHPRAPCSQAAAHTERQVRPVSQAGRAVIFLSGFVFGFAQFPACVLFREVGGVGAGLSGFESSSATASGCVTLGSKPPPPPPPLPPWASVFSSIKPLMGPGTWVCVVAGILDVP